MVVDLLLNACAPAGAVPLTPPMDTDPRGSPRGFSTTGAGRPPAGGGRAASRAAQRRACASHTRPPSAVPRGAHPEGRPHLRGRPVCGHGPSHVRVPRRRRHIRPQSWPGSGPRSRRRSRSGQVSTRPTSTSATSRGVEGLAPRPPRTARTPPEYPDTCGGPGAATARPRTGAPDRCQDVRRARRGHRTPPHRCTGPVSGRAEGQARPPHAPAPVHRTGVRTCGGPGAATARPRTGAPDRCQDVRRARRGHRTPPHRCTGPVSGRAEGQARPPHAPAPVHRTGVRTCGGPGAATARPRTGAPDRCQDVRRARRGHRTPPHRCTGPVSGRAEGQARPPHAPAPVHRTGVRSVRCCGWSSRRRRPRPEVRCPAYPP